MDAFLSGRKREGPLFYSLVKPFSVRRTALSDRIRLQRHIGSLVMMKMVTMLGFNIHLILI